MATTIQQRYRKNIIDNDFVTAKASQYLAPVGRFFYSLIFILSGLNHFNSETINYAASSGLPFANFLVPLSGLLAIIGGLSVLIGYKARWGALCLIVFLIPVTLKMHAFWDITDPQMKQMQMISFMKNLSMLGGAFLLTYFGAGAFSLDRNRTKRTI